MVISSQRKTKRREYSQTERSCQSPTTQSVIYLGRIMPFMTATGRSVSSEKVPHRHPPELASIDLSLQICQGLFKGADRPTMLGIQDLYRWTDLIERADIPHFHRATIRPFIDPSKRQALGTAYIRTIWIDPAGLFLVQEGTGPFGPRLCMGQELAVVMKDVRRLHLKDRQVILATVAAPLAALEPVLVQDGQGLHLMVHQVIQPGQGLQGGISIQMGSIFCHRAILLSQQRNKGKGKYLPAGSPLHGHTIAIAEISVFRYTPSL
jgi:hypothetical protein